MSTENGIYQHYFYMNYTNPKYKIKCYICGDITKNHINYDNNKDNILLDTNETELKNKNLDDLKFDCIICGELISSSDIIEYKKCNHQFCKQCWLNYLTEKIINSNIGKIKCISYQCKEILDEEFIISIISKDKKLIEKYNLFKERLKILNDENTKFCPYPNCDGYGRRKDKNEKYIKCNKGHKFCFNCLKNWDDSECEIELELDFKKWAKNKILKKCPNCKIWTEKNEGCNHMTCAECKYQCCWLCLGEYNLNHYSKGKCNGLQFYIPKSEKK